MKELKLIDFPKQTFTAQLSGKKVKFHFHYSGVAEKWLFDMFVNDGRVLSGRKVILNMDLLEHFTFLEVGKVFAVDPEEAGNPPNRENIPAGVIKIFHATEEDVENAVAQEAENAS